MPEDTTISDPNAAVQADPFANEAHELLNYGAEVQAGLASIVAEDVIPPASNPAVMPPAVQTVDTSAQVPTPVPAPVPSAVEVTEFVRAQAEARREIEAAKADARTKAAETARLTQELSDIRAKLRENPLEVARTEGWDLESIQRSVMQGGTPESVQIRRLEDRLAAMESARNAQVVADATAREVSSATAAIEAFKDANLATFKSVEAAFPLTAAFLETAELRDSLYDVIAREYETSGRTTRLTVAQAAERLEKQLSARVTRVQAMKTPPTGAPVVPTSSPKPPTPSITNESTANTVTDELGDDLSLSLNDLISKGTRELQRAHSAA